MANLCTYCQRKWPPEPVRMLALGDGWFECCVECHDSGKGSFTNAETGEQATFAQLWAYLNPEGINDLPHMPE